MFIICFRLNIISKFNFILLDKNPDINLSLTESELRKHLNVRVSLDVLETLYLLNYTVLY